MGVVVPRATGVDAIEYFRVILCQRKSLCAARGTAGIVHLPWRLSIVQSCKLLGWIREHGNRIVYPCQGLGFVIEELDKRPGHILAVCRERMTTIRATE